MIPYIVSSLRRVIDVKGQKDGWIVIGDDPTSSINSRWALSQTLHCSTHWGPVAPLLQLTFITTPRLVNALALDPSNPHLDSSTPKVRNKVRSHCLPVGSATRSASGI